MFEWIISELAMVFTYVNTGVDLHQTTLTGIDGLVTFIHAYKVYVWYVDTLPVFILVLISISVALAIISTLIENHIDKKSETKELTEA